MLDLDRDLRRYTEYLDEMVEPIEIPVIEPDRAAGRPLHTRRLIPALGAAVVLIVALGLLIVLGPFGGDEAPFVEEPTTVSTIVSEEPPTASTAQRVPDSSVSTTEAPATNTTVALPDPPSISWTRISDPSIFGGERAQKINAVAAVSDCGTEGCGPVDALIAVGSDRSGTDFTFDAAVWVSQDGQSWRRIPHDEPTLGGDQHETMLDVAGNGGRVVAVGAIQVGTPSARASDQAAIWLSDDLGGTWRRGSLGNGQSSRSLSTVVPFGSGFLAGGDGLWISEDGEAWTLVGPEMSTGYVYRINPTEGGWLALRVMDDAWMEWVDRLGARWTPLATRDGGDAWMSPNGYDWSRVALVPGFGDVTDVSDGLVGFGEIPVGDMGSKPAVWRSADGSNWTILNDNLTGGNTIHFHQPVAIEPVGDWLLAVGNQMTRAFWSRPRLYMSPDEGRSWLELEIADTFGQLYDPGSGVYDSVVLTDGTGRQTIVMVGVWGGSTIDDTTPGEDQHDGAVWIGTIED